MSGKSSTQRSGTVREVFTAALQCGDAATRESLLARECGGDDRLRREVEALLDEASVVGDFLEKPAVEDQTVGALRGPHEELEPGERPGDQIGPYHLLELVGEGGGGSVYRAEQRNPVRRTVALKILKLGMDTRSVIQRFEIERQSLAVMEHPNIAKVLDAGASADGRPFFVMEFVEGEPITDYCDAQRLAVRDRVALFIKVCRAVSHAHQKGIIHRDLKPSNILVAEQDDEAMPKVIDFGVAKAIDPNEGDRSLTMVETVIGTPAYMSPEQADRGKVDVDTRSDVYSLGVLLYELLTGSTPLDDRAVKDGGVDALREFLRDVVPPLPSLRLRGTCADEASGVAAARGVGVHKLQGELSGDLDWITMKCLERDRTLRYGSASEFAVDLENFLKGLPVTASPPRAVDRVRKFMGRHKPAVAVAVLLLLTLIAGVVISSALALRARHAEREMRDAHKLQSALRREAVREREDALHSAATARLHEYVADINVSHHAVRDGHIAKALGLLERQGKSDDGADLRGFEWRYLAGRCLGEPHRTLPRQSTPITTLEFSVRGDLLAIGTYERLIVWDLIGDRILFAIPGYLSAVVFSESAEQVIVAHRQQVHVYDLKSGELVKDLQDGGDALAISPEGTLLAVSDQTGVTLWRTADWRQRDHIPNASGPLAFSPDGASLAVGSERGIELWPVEEEGAQRVLEGSAVPLRVVLPGGERVAFSRDGRLLLAPHIEKSSRGVFCLGAWDAASGRELGIMPERPVDEGHSGMVTALALDRSGAVLASGSFDHSVRLWDLESRRLLRTLHGHRGEVWTLSISPGGDYIASGSKDGEVKIWPMVAGAPAKSIEGRWRPLSFSNDSRYVGALNREGGVAIMNLDTRKVVHRIEVSSSDARYGRFVTSLSNDLTTLAEALPAGEVRVRVLEQDEDVRLFRTGSKRLDLLALSPDGTTLVSVGDGDALAWWELNDLSSPILRASGRSAVFSSDGGTLVTVKADGESVVWDTKSRTERARIVHRGHSFGFSAALSPDGRYLAMTYGIDDFENAISLWDATNGDHLGTLTGHKQAIWSVAFSPDGRTLASSSADGALRLWNVSCRRELLSIDASNASLSDLRFSPDGNYLIGGTPFYSNPGELRIIHAPPIDFKNTEERFLP